MLCRSQSYWLCNPRLEVRVICSQAYIYICLQGPTETPYEGGTFELIINVPDQYPLVPPNVRYRTKIFHPNVHFKVSCLICATNVISMYANLHKSFLGWHLLSTSTCENLPVTHHSPKYTAVTGITYLLIIEVFLFIPDWRDLLGHLEDSMEPSMDAAVGLPSHCFSHVRFST